MASWQRLLQLGTALIAVTFATQCGSTSDAPPAQVLLYVDTDAPSASKARAQQMGFLSDSAVDTLRVEFLSATNATLRWRDISAPDEANWPISFGIEAADGTNVARLRLRAFRAQTARLSSSSSNQLQQYDPSGPYTIDRVVEIPIPAEKGAFAYRVVLGSECRGKLPNFLSAKTCISRGQESVDYRGGIEVVSPGRIPSREASWVQTASTDCAKDPCARFPGTKCVEAGFFMLGNSRVVGFTALQREDAVPPHPVAMQAFCIDKQEMTVRKYAELVAQQADLVPKKANGTTYVAADKQLCTWKGDKLLLSSSTEGYDPPMNCVSRLEAQRACEARGGRLPTEAEWEFVASGRGRGHLFPWSDTPPTCDSASLGRGGTEGDEACSVGGLEKIESIGSHLSTPNGAADLVDDVQDLAGSMSEWMLDTYAPYDSVPQCWGRDGLLRHPQCALEQFSDYSIRGGNWASPLETAYVALRWNDQAATHSDVVGFRCVFPIGDDPVAKGTTTGPAASAPDAGASRPGGQP